ncbi:hypothetical protein F5Y04DRAFT_52409 [Hypomontagnella monticulosa]|nr:hypothetical protein F5Y04DRAFT_52409 [Hypomontagnella monticulosa]
MPKFFIPARNSRHRTACFALYRALLKQAPQVQLPNDLVTAWGPANPIKHLIRRAFRRNRADTSPRLVYPALKAGYQILAVLRSAASSPLSLSTSTSKDTASSPAPNADYASIINFLRSRLAERNATLAAKAIHPPHSRNPPKQSSAPRPDATPLLVNIGPTLKPTKPDPKPVYISPSRPRPASELGGTRRRKIPKLDMASDFPFLRIKKPQPANLSRVLTQKIRKRVARTESVQTLWEEAYPDARLEDEWDDSMARLLERHKGQGERGRQGEFWGDSGGGLTPEMRGAKAIHNELGHCNTFGETIKLHGIRYTEGLLRLERNDQVARADAMRAIIEKETNLAAQEKVRRRQRWEAKMLKLHGEGWRDHFPWLTKAEAK